MAGRRDSFHLSASGPKSNLSESVHTTSGNVNNGMGGSNCANSFESLTFDLNKYTKFESCFRCFIRLAREFLTRDHTSDSFRARTLNTQQYYFIRDCAAAWLAKPENTALFTGRETHFYLAQMAATIQTLETALAIPHQPIRWPGAAPGPSPARVAISNHEVFCQFDQLIRGD